MLLLPVCAGQVQEKERKARRKAAAAADKAAKVAAGEEVAEGEEGENGEGGAEGTTQRDGAAEGEKEKGAKGKKKGKKGGDKDLSEEAEAALTKRQRKRLAAGRSKAGGEGAEANVLKKGARGGGETGPYVWMAAAAAALIILVLLFLGVCPFLISSSPSCVCFRDFLALFSCCSSAGYAQFSLPCFACGKWNSTVVPGLLILCSCPLVPALLCAVLQSKFLLESKPAHTQ